jgi:hypothetical protein
VLLKIINYRIEIIMEEHGENKFKIGLLVSNESIREQYYDMISKLSNKITFIIVYSHCDYRSYVRPRLSRWQIIVKKLDDIFWAKYIKFETSRTKAQFGRLNVSDLGLQRVDITGRFSKSKLAVRYEKSDIETVQKENFDLLLRINAPGIFKGDILNASRLGILSMHHGDNRWNRGVPAGFWEVYYGKAESGYIFQILSEVLDGGRVIYRGAVATASYYTTNYFNLFSNSVFFLEKTLLQMSVNKKLPGFEDQYGYDGPLYKKPRAVQIIFFLFKVAFRKGAKKLYPEIAWNVYFKNTEIGSAALNNFVRVRNPRGRWFADPFLHAHLDTTYLFVEDYDVKSRKGSISVLRLAKDKYEYLGKALEEEFHLSYPFIFDYKGSIYMIPETKEDESIRLYKAVEFPLKWEFEKYLIKNIKSVDTTIIKIDEVYWMFTNQEIANNTRNTCLFLYKSSSPISSEWIEHKNNPVEFKNGARNGGLITLPGKTVRVGQKFGYTEYGRSISMYQPNLISLENYREELIHEYEPKFDKDIGGVHHINNTEDYVTFDAFKKINFTQK